MFGLFVVSLGASISDLGIIAFAYAITGVFAGIFTGRISDKYNRNYIYAIASYMVAFSSLLFTTVNDWRLVIPLAIFRTISGLTLASSWRSLIADSVSKGKRGWAFGMITTVELVSSMTGTAVAGYVADSYGFSLMWYVDSITWVCGGTFVLLTLKETRSKTIAPQSSKIGQGLRSRIMMHMRIKDPLLIVYVSILLFAFQDKLVSPFLPAFLEMNGLSIFLIGLTDSATGLILAIAATSIGKLSDKIGRKPPLITSLLIGTIFVGMIPLVTANTYALFAASSFAFLALDSWYLMRVILPLVADLTSEQSRGSAMGFMFTMSSLGSMIGSLTGQYLWKAAANMMPFFSSATISLFATLMVILFVKETVTKKRQT